MQSATDLTGKIFGRWKVIERAEPNVRKNGAKDARWLCRCECGMECIVYQNGLLSGKSTQCKKCNLKYKRNLIGNKYGRLKVIGFDEISKQWICECECGNITRKKTINLTSGDCKSCGCLSEENKSKIKDAPAKYRTHDTNISKLKSNKPYSNNKSGKRGVSFSKSHKKWVARISFQKKQYILGVFENKDDAIRIRTNAEEKIFKDFLEWYCKKHD